MQFDTYVRKPFTVEAIEITEENLDELAQYIGTIRIKDDGSDTRFIQVDRRLVPNIDRVYVGFFMTRMKSNVRCYSPRTFKEQFELQEDSATE